VRIERGRSGQLSFARKPSQVHSRALLSRPVRRGCATERNNSDCGAIATRIGVPCHLTPRARPATAEQV
jgi:hypothetical protein